MVKRRTGPNLSAPPAGTQTAPRRNADTPASRTQRPSGRAALHPPFTGTASHKPLVSATNGRGQNYTRLTQRPEIICHIDLFSNFHIFMTRLLPDSQTASPRQRRWGRTSPAYLARLVAPTPVALLRLLRPSSRAPGHHKDSNLGRDVSVRDTAVCAHVPTQRSACLEGSAVNWPHKDLEAVPQNLSFLEQYQDFRRRNVNFWLPHEISDHRLSHVASQSPLPAQTTVLGPRHPPPGMRTLEQL